MKTIPIPGHPLANKTVRAAFLCQIRLVFSESGNFQASGGTSYFDPPLVSGHVQAGKIYDTTSPDTETEVSWTFTSDSTGKVTTGKIVITEDADCSDDGDEYSILKRTAGMRTIPIPGHRDVRDVDDGSKVTVGYKCKVDLSFGLDGDFERSREGGYFEPPLPHGPVLAGTQIISVSPDFETEVKWTFTTSSPAKTYRGEIDVEKDGGCTDEP